MTADLLPPFRIRALFAREMSAMYRTEVPLYGDLLEIVEEVNRDILEADSLLERQLGRHDELERLGEERHGAIRLGTPAELNMMRRAFAVMGMYPVGYYDLSVAGVPVHSTAFRPVNPASINRNPFRIFTSLLRLELIEDEALREEAGALLEARRIFSDEAIALVEQFETAGGLTQDEAERFVSAVLQTFRWHSDALVDAETYGKLHDVHRLVADVVCFKGPHINHLTPRTLDIDAAQAEMEVRGMGAKAVIEGPPRRRVPILLRQTSFKALEEDISFAGSATGEAGTHTARFGEIEQRGAALTPRGRELYDELLAEARGSEGAQSETYSSRLERAFERFPDDVDTLRREGLAYFHYRLGDRDIAPGERFDLDALLASGVVEAHPITYEDFLPVSAAGIFQSNLGGEEQRVYSAAEAQAALEAALGVSIADGFSLYAAMEEASLAEVKAVLAPSEIALPAG